MKTIAFFGHRQIFNDCIIREKLINALKKEVVQDDIRLLIGCHGDFDELALSTCLYFMNNNNCNMEINVVLTNLSFLNKDENGYSRADIYKSKGCKTIFYDIERIYFKTRITVSNKKMVDESDLIICYVDMKAYKSGAKTAVNYALNKKKKVINLF